MQCTNKDRSQIISEKKQPLKCYCRANKKIFIKNLFTLFAPILTKLVIVFFRDLMRYI